MRSKREQNHTSSDITHTYGNRHDLDKPELLQWLRIYIQKKVYSIISVNCLLDFWLTLDLVCLSVCDDDISETYRRTFSEHFQDTRRWTSGCERAILTGNFSPFFISSSPTLGCEGHNAIGSSIRHSFRCPRGRPSVNTYFAWSDISILEGFRRNLAQM